MKQHGHASSLRNPLSLTLWIIWLLTLGVALGGPLIAQLLGMPDPTEPMTRAFDTPSAAHPLGTDRLGRDLAARMLLGNASLVIPPLIAAVATTTLGIGFATLALLSTTAQKVIRFLGDTLLAIPAIIILLAVITATNGSFIAVALAAVLLSLPISTRYFLATARDIFDTGFVRLARTTGASWPQIILHDVLPALRRPAIADVAIRFVSVVFLSTTAAFLAGASGAQESSWAAMVGSGLSGVDLNPWAVAAPVIAIVALTACPALLLEQHSGSHR